MQHFGGHWVHPVEFMDTVYFYGGNVFHQGYGGFFQATYDWSMEAHTGSALRFSTGAYSGTTYGVIQSVTQGNSALGNTAISPYGGSTQIGQAGNGVILKSADGSCFMLSASNLGVPVMSPATCVQ